LSDQGEWNFHETLNNFLVCFKVGQGYGTLPDGLMLTGKPIPQFAPTGNLGYVLEVLNFNGSGSNYYALFSYRL
jgi:hypothetical protein